MTCSTEPLYSKNPNPGSRSDIRAIQRVTWLGLIINIFLAGLKFFAGIWGSSQVLIADAVHSSSDLATDVAILVGSRYWGQPADADHPNGHAKIETLVTLLIGLALALVGFELIQNAIGTIYQIKVQGQQPTSPGWIALIAAILSVISKEWLYQVTAWTGRVNHSPATVANAWHHRSDAMSSIPAALAVGGVLWLGKDFAFLDPLGTVVVGFMIMYTAFEIVHPTIGTLLDASAGEKILNTIREIALEAQEVQDVHKIRTRPLGSGLYAVDLHIQVDSNMNVKQAHHLSHFLQDKICAREPTIVEATIHIEPNSKN